MGMPRTLAGLAGMIVFVSYLTFYTGLEAAPEEQAVIQGNLQDIENYQQSLGGSLNSINSTSSVFGNVGNGFIAVYNILLVILGMILVTFEMFSNFILITLAELPSEFQLIVPVLIGFALFFAAIKIFIPDY